ncbi:MAG: NTP transferase domain-containing protein [Oscillospiraceae bacterium]|jgi:bifunctional UDP-N-acetylglucosamine pyrophosphorylase/glucosamine-1-phosphate N-acetyltransferase|nr:NTP transferase domain-containing protein [Oscillospiraceae bacterium]
MENLCGLILAAGEGRRMKTSKPKTLLKVLSKPMLGWVLDAAKKSKIRKICIVAGYGREFLEKYLSSFSSRNPDLAITMVVQKERLGTGHAVLLARKFLENETADNVVVLNGDSPLLDSNTIKKAYELHKCEKNDATVISAKVKNPFGYGRIIRKNKKVTDIVEQKDANEKTLKINEINSGAYWFRKKSLLSILHLIKNNNVQNEYYITDAVKLLLLKGQKIGSFDSGCGDLVLGANDPEQLNIVNAVACQRIIRNHIKNGVDIPNTEGITIGPDVTFGSSCKVFKNSIILGKMHIGNNCKIGPDVFIDGQNIKPRDRIFGNNIFVF